MQIITNSDTRPIPFLLVQSADHISGLTGATATVTISKNGAAFGSPSGAVAEIGSGWYKLTPSGSDTTTNGSLILHATASNADPTDEKCQVVAVDIYDATRFGLSALPNIASGSAGAVPTTGTGANQISVSSGQVILQSGTGTGQLDFTSGVVKANFAQILGTALTETAGLLAGAFKKFFNVATPTGTVNSIPDAVAGATGGLLIAGSNAATTFLSVTCTGTFTISDGWVITRSTANSPAIKATGSGSGSGAQIQGGATGAGFYALGGGTSGAAVYLQGAGSNGGIECYAGPTGSGVYIAGGGTSGLGVSINTTNGVGIGVTTGGNGHGIAIAGAGAGDGINTVGGSTGQGIQAIGGSSNGHGMICTSPFADGFAAVGQSVGSRGVHFLGGASGIGAYFSAGTDGSGIIATGNGSGHDITGNLNGGVNGVLSALTVTANAEPTAVPAATASLADKIAWIAVLSRNKITETATTMLVRNNADSATIGTATTSDDGTTATRGGFV